MATTKLTLKGKNYFSKILEGGPVEMGYQNNWQKTGGRYVAGIILDEENADKLERAGTRKKLKQLMEAQGRKLVETDFYKKLKEMNFPLEDTDLGLIKFDRPVHNTKEGMEWTAGPPIVTDHNGVPWPEGKLIGNGSILEVSVDVYETRNPDGEAIKGTRLTKVKVLDLVEYTRPEDSDGEAPEENSTDNQKAVGKPKTEESLDDEIPF